MPPLLYLLRTHNGSAILLSTNPLSILSQSVHQISLSLHSLATSLIIAMILPKRFEQQNILPQRLVSIGHRPGLLRLHREVLQANNFLPPRFLHHFISQYPLGMGTDKNLHLCRQAGLVPETRICPGISEQELTIGHNICIFGLYSQVTLEDEIVGLFSYQSEVTKVFERVANG